MSLKKTVARVSGRKTVLLPLKPVQKYCQYAAVTPTELAPHLGVSRQRASALLHAGRVDGPKWSAMAPDGGWYVWLPLTVSKGSRGPKRSLLAVSQRKGVA